MTAGKNIGKEVALAFARTGANVVVCDYNEQNALDAVKEIEALGVGAMPAVCDVRDRERIFAYVAKAVERFGKIDFLVNNAGGSAGLLGKLTRFADAEPSTLDFVIDVNLKGSMNCAQAVLPSMIAQRYGKIINVASMLSFFAVIYSLLVIFLLFHREGSPRATSPVESSSPH